MSRSRHRLDAIDIDILDHLQNDGRVSNVELAKRVGLSPPPCLRRVRALEDAGFIRGYYAVLDGEQLGYPIVIFVRVSLNSQSASDLKDFEDHVSALPEVRECYMLSGDIDFMLKIVAASTEAFREFQATKLKSFRNIAEFKLSLSFRDSKALRGVPVDSSLSVTS